MNTRFDHPAVRVTLFCLFVLVLINIGVRLETSVPEASANESGTRPAMSSITPPVRTISASIDVSQHNFEPDTSDTVVIVSVRNGEQLSDAAFAKIVRDQTGIFKKRFVPEQVKRGCTCQVGDVTGMRPVLTDQGEPGRAQAVIGTLIHCRKLPVS